MDPKDQPATPPTPPENPDDKLVSMGTGSGSTVPVIALSDGPVATPVTRVKVTIAGKEFEVDAGMAETLQAREDEFNRKLAEQSGELGRLRQQAAGTAPAVPGTPSPSEKKKYSTLLFEDPDEALRQFKDEIVQTLTSLYVDQEGRKEFWAEFRKDYPDLAIPSATRMAQRLLSEQYATLQGLKVGEARKKLADLTRAEIRELAPGGTPPPESPRTTVEGAGGSSPSAPGPTPAGVARRSVSDVLLKRREERSKGKVRAFG